MARLSTQSSSSLSLRGLAMLISMALFCLVHIPPTVKAQDTPIKEPFRHLDLLEMEQPQWMTVSPNGEYTLVSTVKSLVNNQQIGTYYVIKTDTNEITQIQNADFYPTEPPVWLDHQTVAYSNGTDLVFFQAPFIWPIRSLWKHGTQIIPFRYVPERSRLYYYANLSVKSIPNDPNSQNQYFTNINSIQVFLPGQGTITQTSGQETWTMGDRVTQEYIQAMPPFPRDQGQWSIGGGDVSRDGDYMVQVANAYNRPGVVLTDGAIYLSSTSFVEGRGGSPQEAKRINPKTDSPVEGVGFSPDRKYVCWTQRPRANALYDNPILYVYDVDTGKTIKLGEKLDRPISKPKFSRDSKTIYALVEDKGDIVMYSFTLDPKDTPKPLTPKNAVVAGMYPVANDAVMFMMSTGTNPGEMFKLDTNTQTTTRTTNFGQSYYNNKFVCPVEKLAVKNTNITVGALLTFPYGYNPKDTTNAASSKRYPLLVIVHDSPNNAGRHEWVYDGISPQVYAGAGFAVVSINVRGSSGYGKKYGEANYANWGKGPAQDVTAVVNNIANKYQFIDCENLHYMGYRYGAYLGMYMSGYTKNFKGMILDSGFFDLRTTYMLSSIDAPIMHSYFGGDPDEEKFRQKYIDNNPANPKVINKLDTNSLVFSRGLDPVEGIVNQVNMFGYHQTVLGNNGTSEYYAINNSGLSYLRTFDLKTFMTKSLLALSSWADVDLPYTVSE
ncbi:hypothetical protein H4219_003685 [Mycoemilia scoparia]|uniref:Dipeptidyl-peptidase V n=1 Tax=Mycoemilia scoparia TaxID=417184 RepID=A0A9W8DSL0_9FUNG|nr:hypothetical protein H4219_003685 [Mycoemilia scoparia]